MHQMKGSNLIPSHRYETNQDLIRVNNMSVLYQKKHYSDVDDDDDGDDDDDLVISKMI